MTKLVAFYSRADENHFGGQYRYIEVGNTEKAAQMIAEMTGADIFKIEQANPYSENYATCIEQVKKDLKAKTKPELMSLRNSIELYDEIYLCYPNYWGTMPMAVYTFLESFDFTGKAIHPFCTHEGSGLSNTIKDIQAVCKGVVLDEGLAISGSSVDHSRNAIEAWISQSNR